jgi:hypothetical protein
MSITLRSVAAAAVATLAASALAVPLTATPAAAVQPVDRVWSLLDGDADGGYGLYYSAGPGAAQTKVEESELSSLDSLSASADGSRVAYVRYTYVPALDDVKQEIVVRDMSTRVVRVLDAAYESDLLFLDLPFLSPDGTRAVWERYDENTDTMRVRKALVASGPVSTLVTDYSPYGFLSDSTVLVQTDVGAAFTLPFNKVSGDLPNAATGIPMDAIHLTASPDGTKVAWALVTQPTAPFRSTVQVAPLTLTDGVASVGAATTLESTLYNRQPAFSRNGSTLFWIKTSGVVGAGGDVWSAPADASGTPAAVAETAAPDRDIALTSIPSSDATAPGAVTTLPALLKGSSVTLGWTLPADADLSGVVVTRKLGGTVQKKVFVPTATNYTDSGLVVNATYTYEFTAVDRANNYGPTASRNVTALKPGAVVSDPTSKTSTKTRFPVKFAAAAPSTTTFTVDYVVGGTSTWKRWVTAQPGLTRTFGGSPSTGVAATFSTPGSTYSFRVRATDAYGNSSALVYVRTATAVVPFDQTKATLSGGTTVASGSAYLGSYRRLWATTHYARVTLTGHRLSVIGWKCTGCGKFRIYDGTTLVATIDTYASSTKARQVLYTRAYSTVRTRTFTIRPVATPGRPKVVLDGFAMRR